MPSVDTTIEPVMTDGERIGCVATITLNNPDRRNAMNAAMYQAVPAACGLAIAEPDLRVVVIRGAGDRAFSAGSDISEFAERRMGRESEGYDRAEHAAWAAIESVPVVMASQSDAAGVAGQTTLRAARSVPIPNRAGLAAPKLMAGWPKQLPMCRRP